MGDELKNNKDVFSIMAAINSEVALLREERSELLQHNSKLMRDGEKLIEERREYIIEIDELKKKLKAMELANDLTSDESKGRAKRRIEAILREIDKCIAIINKR